MPVSRLTCHTNCHSWIFFDMSLCKCRVKSFRIKICFVNILFKTAIEPYERIGYWKSQNFYFKFFLLGLEHKLIWTWILSSFKPSHALWFLAMPWNFRMRFSFTSDLINSTFPQVSLTDFLFFEVSKPKKFSPELPFVSLSRQTIFAICKEAHSVRGVWLWGVRRS